jgi:hypothetical protein
VDRPWATVSHIEPTFNLLNCPMSPSWGDAQQCPEGDWGSRGRRFKSGRPDAAHTPADHGEHRGQRAHSCQRVSRFVSLDEP